MAERLLRRARLRASLEELFGERGVDAVYCEPFGDPGIDSSEMDPGHWLTLSRCVARELERGLTGVLVLHGTDTMAYTAAWLSLCFGNLPVPVILTGSQLTLDYMPEDVTSNLRGAAMACCSDLRGVWVYFNWKLIPGDRAHKSHAMHPDAFSAVNGQPLFFNPDWALESARIPRRMSGPGCLSRETRALDALDSLELRRRCGKIRWFMAAPGASPLWSGDERIVCLLGYGAGNMSPVVLDSLRSAFAEGKKPCVVACSQAEGGVKHPEGYGRVGMACLARDGFVVFNQMDRTAEFVHSLCCYALAVAPCAPGTVLVRWLRESFRSDERLAEGMAPHSSR